MLKFSRNLKKCDPYYNAIDRLAICFINSYKCMDIPFKESSIFSVAFVCICLLQKGQLLDNLLLQYYVMLSWICSVLGMSINECSWLTTKCLFYNACYNPFMASQCLFLCLCKISQASLKKAFQVPWQVFPGQPKKKKKETRYWMIKKQHRRGH